MDFFKALRERALERAMPDTSNYRGGPFEWYLMKEEAHSANGGINATIETLKEMMVPGIPLSRPSNLAHYTTLDGEPRTALLAHGAHPITITGHHGVHGEKVVVMVFKKP